MATDEAMEDVQPGTERSFVDLESLKRKKFKAEDLPLSAAQHAAIDKILHSFRKKGGFDSVRKEIWAEFNDGVCLRSFMLICDVSFGSGSLTCSYRISRPNSLDN